jgi:capsular polysaccharide transport system permease protein
MAAVYGQASFRRSLAIQFRVIGALLLREIITRYGRRNLGFLWLFVEPMLFTLGVTALWSVAGLKHAATIPVVAFAVTGYSSILLWRNCASRCCMAINPNLGLLYHRNVRVLDLMLTRILLEVAGATASFIALSIVWISIGWMEPPDDVLTVVAAWLLLAWFGAALALILGGLTGFSEIWERFWHPTAYLLFPLSGAVFMVEWLPAKLRPFVLWLPMVHGVEFLRHGYFGSVVRAHYDLEYLTGACLGMTLVGLVLVRMAGRRVEFTQ